MGRGLAGTAARTAVVAGTATAVSGRVARRQAGAASQAAGEAAPPAEQLPPPSEAPVEPPQEAPDMYEQLTKLAALRDQGILTEEEFAAQKARILGS